MSIDNIPSYPFGVINNKGENKGSSKIEITHNPCHKPKQPPVSPDFSIVAEFEKRIAEFFGAPFAVATDSCTSALELCLRYSKENKVISPSRTYLSVPMLANKLELKLEFINGEWQDYYAVGVVRHNRHFNAGAYIYDAAVYWKKGGYIPGSFMCVSMQYQKHLSVGRLGVILCNNEAAALELKKLSYDGRIPSTPWREQNVSSFGFHYYAQPELCKIALDKLPAAIATPPRIWTSADYPDVSKMKVFNQLK